LIGGIERFDGVDMKGELYFAVARELEVARDGFALEAKDAVVDGLCGGSGMA
jgi:hypothetical protein